MNGNDATQRMLSQVGATHRDRRNEGDFARTAAGAGAVAWAGVAVLGWWDAVREGTEGNGDGPGYVLYSIMLLLAATLTFVAAWSCTHPTGYRALRRLGLGAGAIAVASTVVAWAGPLWMTTLAVSFAVLAVAAPANARLGLVWVAVAQTIGIIVTFFGVELELGPPGGEGDYSSAQSIAVVLAAAGSAVGAALVLRARRRATKQPQ